MNGRNYRTKRGARCLMQVADRERVGHPVLQEGFTKCSFYVLRLSANG